MPIVEKNKDGGVLNKFYFSFPIDLQLVYKTKTAKEWPTIHLEIYSKDYWERIYMHGCGFVRIPSNPGTHVVEV